MAFDEEFWNDRYRSSDRIWSGSPNSQLISEIEGMPAGCALDVGCGEGADAIWLAQRGWDVVAADISSVALERAEQHARDTDAAAAGRIEWRHADLAEQPAEPNAFDLVATHFMQLPPEPRARMFAGLIASVCTGGTLLVVGHHPSDLETGVRRPRMQGVLYTADDIAALLGEEWTVVVSEARPRPGTTPEGVEVTIHDSVLRAIRR